MKFVDSHSHPQFSQYDEDRKEVLRRAADLDIGTICVGTDLEMSRKAVTLAEQYDHVWASVGLHPNDNQNEPFEPGEYLSLGKNKKVVAFGEIGLDHYRTKETEKQAEQKRKFVLQIETASELNLPLIIHCRDAHEEMFRTLKFYSSSLSENPGVIHSFTGTYEEAKQYIDLGFYLGFNGIITFHSRGSGQVPDLQETVKNIPSERILLETDAPYLTPEPYRGKRNEPAYVSYVAQKIAELRDISIEEVSKTTTENCKKLFDLK